MSPCPSIQARGERERERTNRSNPRRQPTEVPRVHPSRLINLRPSRLLRAEESASERKKRHHAPCARSLATRLLLGGSDRLLLAGAAALAGLTTLAREVPAGRRRGQRRKFGSFLEHLPAGRASLLGPGALHHLTSDRGDGRRQEWRREAVHPVQGAQDEVDRRPPPQLRASHRVPRRPGQ